MPPRQLTSLASRLLTPTRALRCCGHSTRRFRHQIASAARDRAGTAHLHGPIQQLRLGSSHPQRVAAGGSSYAAAGMAQRAAPVAGPIQLTDLEKEIFETLLSATGQAGMKTTLRCAGGWVRDKLLGKESDDIDIALDDLMGKDFAEKINEYLASSGKETHSIGVIQCNPEQSKHLETARMKICGVWLDLVNLRSESYAEGSRIPEMIFGTAEQDAFRRDFTINSMFFNINSGTVEDLTKRGFEDLAAGIIRTPLEPLETFKDDPLRVLRAVRFASRFGFELEESLVAAASTPEVRSELIGKVSKERVGAELDGMFSEVPPELTSSHDVTGPDPVAAMRLLHQLRLFPAVFLPPEEMVAGLGAEFGEPCVGSMSHTMELLKDPGCQVQLDPESRRLCLLAGLLLPLRRIMVAKPGKSDKHTSTLPCFLVRDALKRRTKDAEAMTALHKGAEQFLAIWQKLREAGEATPPLRTELGHIVRNLKELWEVAAVLAPILDVPEASPLGVETPHTDGPGSAPGPQEGRLAMVNGLRDAVCAAKLDKAYTFKPMLDGKAVMAVLGLKKGGPQLGQAMSKIMDWQLAHPDKTVDELKAMLADEMSGN